MADCKLAVTPMVQGIKFNISQKLILTNANTYRKLNGSLLYLTITRLDISFVVNFLPRYMQNPYMEHLNVLKRILRYIYGIRNLALNYSSLQYFELVGYLDASYVFTCITTHYISIAKCKLGWTYFVLIYFMCT